VTPIEGVLNVNPAAVLVFVDETGPEWFEDPNYPLFALGGLVVPALSYFETVSGAWENLKGRHFGGRSVRLHAAEIDRSNSAGISAIGHFFRELEFGRIAVALTVRTGRPAELPPYQVAASALLPRLVAVVRWIRKGGQYCLGRRAIVAGRPVGKTVPFRVALFARSFWRKGLHPSIAESHAKVCGSGWTGDR
jgi:hypothetical protein